jgi:D-alanyl-D-alanine carboxypeptidase (penicillin-binding protein 5/6)
MRAIIVALSGCVLAIAGPVAAQAPTGDPLSVAGKHIAILDHETGQTLYCRDCTTPMPPASMSKLMTMLVVADQLRAGKLKLEQMVPVSEAAWRLGAQSDGSHMFLELNSQVSVENLLKGVIIVSANDACIALAEAVSGHEGAFVDLMNKRAQELGLTSARFRNVTGLPDPEHVISAQDLAKLASILIRDYPDLYKFYAQRDFTFDVKKQENRNPLLGKFNGADGVKTGHTAVSGYGLVGSAIVNNQRRIIVFNGATSMAERGEIAKSLMNAAFFDFTVTDVFKKDEVVGEAEVWLGGRKTVQLLAARDVRLGVHRSAQAGLKAAIVYKGPLLPPIKKGAGVATLVIEGPGLRQEYPLVAARSVGRANPFARAGYGLGQMFAGS